MCKFNVDLSERALFKGIRINFDHIDEGILHARKHNINSVCIWNGTDSTRKTTDFDFLKEADFIERFEWLVPLTRASNIEGLYHLKNLKYLRCAWDNDLAIDYSKLTHLKTLAMKYYPRSREWHSLTNLRELYIQSVGTADLAFLSSTKNLEVLRIINGSITSLDGLENCKKLKNLRILKCKKLTDATETLTKLPALERLALEGCKNLDINRERINLPMENIFIA